MKFTVEKIDARARETLRRCKGKDGSTVVEENLTAKQMRLYAHQVLYLTKEIDTLRKNLLYRLTQS